MNYGLLILGMFIITLDLIDLVWATLWVDHGAGPISKSVANNLWVLMKKIDKNNKILMLSGPIILVINLLIWVLVLWLGWTLVFLSFNDGLINTINESSVEVIDYFYYTGYVLFTLGSGELAPVPSAMKLLSAFASGLGMIFLTLGVSYIISIIDGVVKKRTIGRHISSMGMTAEDIVLSSWSGDYFYNLDNIFNTLTTGIDEITFKERAYPLLHFYHGKDRHYSLTYNLSILDDAISVLEYGIKGDQNLNMLALRQLRSSINLYVESFGEFGKDLFELQDKLPDINLKLLKEKNMPVISQEEFNNRLEKIKFRRVLLADISKENWDILPDFRDA